MSRVDLPRVRERIERLAQASMSCEEFQWHALSELRRIVPFEAMCWNLVDPTAVLPSWVVADHPVIAAQQRLLHQLTRDELTQMPDAGVTVLSAVTGGDLARNTLWREMLGPANLGDVLTASLTADGRCWGMLHLYRDKDSRWFTDSDAAVVSSLSSGLAGRLRASLTAPAGVPASGDGPGTIILDRDLELVAVTPTAQRWLSRLPARAPHGPEPLPGFVYAVATRARFGVDAKPSAGAIDLTAARLRIRASDGTWLLLRAAPLSPSAQLGTQAVAVTIEAARPAELSPLLMRAYRLTAREREVASLVTAGVPTSQIAASLFITNNTIGDHLKAIFAKVGVRNRHQLSDALSGRASPADQGGTQRVD